MTTTAGRGLDALCQQLTGRVITVRDDEYDAARSVWNGAIDHRPEVLVRCADARDVAAAIGFARDSGLEIAVRGGAHNMAGAAVGDGGLTIDLSDISDVSVSPGTRTARCGGGATLAQFDAATQAHGLATTGGTVSHTGVGGLTLGGGFGWLTSQHGLSCDNLLSAEVVTADGRIIRASADREPDLFWALRGGGGNFGVVTEFEFQLHPLSRPALLGLFFWEQADGPQALTVAGQVASELPARMGAMIAALNAPPAPFVPAEHHFKPGYALLVAAFGAEGEHQRLAGEIRAALPPLFDVITPIPYVALQQLLDEAARWGVHAYEKGIYVDALTPEVITVITERMPGRSSPMSMMLSFPMGGGYCAVRDEDTAFGGRRAPGFVVVATALADGPEPLAADRDWACGFWQDLLPYAAGPGGYVNFMAEYEADRVRASYGPAKYQRLAGIKARYDPANVFHRNANIVPAA